MNVNIVGQNFMREMVSTKIDIEQNFVQEVALVATLTIMALCHKYNHFSTNSKANLGTSEKNVFNQPKNTTF